jgi:NDP-sugar pyrophosphorylase family protein|tara:strand:+ start:3822 stop:4046 length:225 start_codon:yes stop_codon:yes gene_type:complete
MNNTLNREELTELKELLAERMVDNMSTKDLVEYVTDDLFQYFDKLGEHEFLEEAKNYWDDHYEDVVNEIKEEIQ